MKLRVSTEQVYAIGYDDELVVRPGAKIIIDSAHYFKHLGDTGGIVPVESGLEARDVAVFISYFGIPEGEDTPREDTVGYIVSAVDSIDGSGMLIHDAMIDRQPASTVSNELLEKLKYIDTIEDGTIVGNFSLSELHAYVKNHRD